MSDIQIYKNNVDEINDLHKGIQESFYDVIQRGLRIGELLVEKKAKLKHSEWIDWIENNLIFEDRQARKYMQLFKEQKLLNRNSSSDLKLSSINSALSEIRNVKKKQKKAKIIDINKEKETEFEKDKDDNFKILFGKFQKLTKKIPDNSIDTIITDPPYGKEFLKEWENLSKIAKRILKESGFLITYSGTLNLNRVFKILDKNLIFYWQIILIHKGQNQLINPRNIFCNYKPILIYQKEPFKRIQLPFDDIFDGSGREKELHEWQQAEEESVYLIKNFTSPNDLILDPFAGSGTIPIAAYKLKRRIIAIDDNEENIKIIKERKVEAKEGNNDIDS